MSDEPVLAPIILEITDEETGTTSRVILPFSDATLLRTLAQDWHMSQATLVARALTSALYPPFYLHPADEQP